MAINVRTLILGELQTNTYIVEDTDTNDCLVVDPATDDDILFNAVESKNVKYILLTHGHFDHIGGVKKLRQKTGAKIVIHNEDNAMLSNPDLSLFSFQYPNKEANLFSADIVVNNGDEIDFDNIKIKVMHTPGHTPGGVCYIFEKSRIFFTGDTLFHLSAGRTDFPGGDPRAELCSLSKIASLDGDYVVYPGHDKATTLQYERDNNRYLKMSILRNYKR